MINYYRFTGYAIQFRKDSLYSTYVKNITIEKIYNIYLFDEAMRNSIKKYIEKIEIYFRTQIAYGFSIAKCQEPPHDQHYNEENYYNKQSFRNIAQSFVREKNYFKDSLIIEHHKNKYADKMPLWVCVEFMTFSTISRLYKSMYSTEQDIIAQAVGTTRKILSNHLYCLSLLRNKCAHAARLYNDKINLPARLSSTFLRKNPDIMNNSLFAYIVILGKRLPLQEDKKQLITKIDKIINTYKNNIDLKCIGFPKEYKKIMEEYFL